MKEGVSGSMRDMSLIKGHDLPNGYLTDLLPARPRSCGLRHAGFRVSVAATLDLRLLCFPCAEFGLVWFIVVGFFYFCRVGGSTRLGIPLT